MKMSGTLRRCNVATSVRMLFSHHLKANRRQNLGYRETYGLGAEIRAEKHRSGRRARDLYCFFVFDN